MKLVDYAEKYDMQPTLYPEGTWVEGVFYPNSKALEDMVLWIISNTILILPLAYCMDFVRE